MAIVPYSLNLNDIIQFEAYKFSTGEYEQHLKDEFDQLYEDKIADHVFDLEPLRDINEQGDWGVWERKHFNQKIASVAWDFRRTEDSRSGPSSSNSGFVDGL